MANAACRDSPTPDLWHPDGPNAEQQAEKARPICHGCPVRAACLEFALGLLAATGQLHGIWGAMTARQIREVAASQSRPSRKVAQHGTRSRYVRGCRCRRCRAANATDKRRRQPPLRAKLQRSVDLGQAWCAADRCLETERWIRPGADWALPPLLGGPSALGQVTQCPATRTAPAQRPRIAARPPRQKGGDPRTGENRLLTHRSQTYFSAPTDRTRFAPRARYAVVEPAFVNPIAAGQRAGLVESRR
jgi:Transcription factor WhiB